MRISYGPLVTSARGSLGSVTATSLRGRAALRIRAPRADPVSAPQLAIRNTFANLSGLYTRQSTPARTAWSNLAGKNKIAPHTAHLRGELTALNGQTDLVNWMAVPDSNLPAPVITSISYPIPATIQVVMTFPADPPGYTKHSICCVTLPEQNFAAGPANLSYYFRWIAPELLTVWVAALSLVLSQVRAFLIYDDAAGALHVSSATHETGTAT